MMALEADWNLMANSQTTPKPEVASARTDIPGRGLFGRLFRLRKDVPLWQSILFGVLCLAMVAGLWWFLTRPWFISDERPEGRLLNYYALPSPEETFGKLPSLWFDAALTRNLLATVERVVLGFGLAAVIGIPIGILCGCFARFNAFFTPLVIWGRYIPIAAVLPLLLFLFGSGELHKVMFIFIASVAFVISDSARSIVNVGNQYVDTAATLGASRWQIIVKVLVPLAMPDIFNSLRLLFGLAFGYIMLAEVIADPDRGGIGFIINVAQGRGGNREYIILILLIIPLVALLIDRTLYWVQRELFPHRYGGAGVLNSLVRACLHGWEDAKGLLVKPASAPAAENTSERTGTKA